MEQGLERVHVVVLGASNPTGLAMVVAHAKAGATVDVLARTPEQAELIGLRLAAHPNVCASALDFASEEEVARAADRIEAARGPVDHVVVCLRYGGRGDSVWGGEGQIGEVHEVMAGIWLPRLPSTGSFQFYVCADRPAVGLQPQGPALVECFEVVRERWGAERRTFLVAAGPVDADVAAASVALAADAGSASEKIVMPGAFTGDPDWDTLLRARADLDLRLAARAADTR